MCRDASVSVAAIATFNGLNAANSSSTEKDGQAAGADCHVGRPSAQRVSRAVILFGVVLNKNTGGFNLSTQEIRDIFLGAITNWRQVGGANLPIKLVARTTGSGTRAIFDSKVLGRAEPPFSSYSCLTKTPSLTRR